MRRVEREMGDKGERARRVEREMGDRRKREKGDGGVVRPKAGQVAKEERGGRGTEKDLLRTASSVLTCC